MAMINIDPQKKDDAFYRYKMPAIITKIEGNGNGIKTVFPNIVDVCARLGRPADVLNKFFGTELGAQSTYISNDDKYLVMGKHTQERIQDKVYDFIKRFVLCRKCRNPETKLETAPKNKLTMRCGACSHVGSVDNTERIFNMLYLGVSNAEKAQAAGKKDETVAKGAAVAKPADDAHEEEINAKNKVIPKKIDSTAEDLQHANPIVTLSEAMANKTTSDALIRQVLNLKNNLNLKDRLVTRLIFRATIEGVPKETLIGALQKQLPMFRHFIAGAKAGAKEEQEEMCIRELLIACHQRECLQKFPMGLKMLWEEGVVSETTILNFLKNETESKSVDKMPVAKIKEAKDKAAPLAAWLEDDN